ncbi:restriction endonuclease subunit S [Mycoplasmopsis cynos]|uniref:restriction endonuclease subunit S n=1 Tax=Mycoplasmopsis cynos TaxID=171284 RepID=UPI00220BC11C|nr:restriction endonuclease subunit S [Mycoplasmopsis cynos]UWV86432.1 restriction endonuclease subunit S [Mycoplasmopsis cynos]
MIVGKNLTILSVTLTKMTNVWEQERLGNLCEQAKSRAVITDIKSRGKYDLYGVNGFIGKTNLTPINNGKKAILVVVDGSVGKTLILPPNSVFTSTLEALYIKEGFLIDFLFNSLKTEQLLKFSTGSIIKHLYFNEYRGINILVPNLKEQNKISIIFWQHKLPHHPSSAWVKNSQKLQKITFPEYDCWQKFDNFINYINKNDKRLRTGKVGKFISIRKVRWYSIIE